tara:strand:- start:19360 stop:20538 length:1179 start_codon:yes stop_codon:yes gene_type:complete
MQYKIPFSSRSIDYTEKEINLIVEVIKNANPLTMGSNLDKFEKKFKHYSNTKYAFAVNTATSALELTAQLINFKKNDEIIIPTHTYTSSCYPFIKAGAKVVWADIDLETRVISDKSVEENISSRTKAILVPHLYGYFKDLTNLLELIKGKNIYLIEDAAQAIGSQRNGKLAGTMGDFGIYSFHSHKNITTLGEGGMITIKEKKFAQEIAKLRHNGHCSFDFDREKYWLPAMGNLDLSIIDGEKVLPNNYCISETQCALGSVLLDRVDEINETKRKRAIKFIDELKNYDFLRFHRVESKEHNYHLLAAYFSIKDLRDKFISNMAEEMKIQCAVQYYPLNRYDFYQKLGLGKSNCKNADYFFDNMVSFPFHSRISDTEFEYILESTKKILNKII